MKQLELMINNALEKEDAGEYMEGIRILEELIRENRDCGTELLQELSMMYFRNSAYSAALLGLIELYYITQNEEYLQFILDSYSVPNQEECHRNYNSNIEILSKFPCCFCDILPSFHEVAERYIWQDENKMIYFSEGRFVEKKDGTYNTDNLNCECAIVLNEFNPKEILKIQKRMVRNLNSHMPQPLYLYYDKKDFNIMLQAGELTGLLNQGTIVFIIGEARLKEFFMDTQSILPSVIMKHEQENEVCRVLSEVEQERKKWKETLEQITIPYLEDYYSEQKEQVTENIKNRNPRILFVTSRFTTALQFHAKNLCQSAKKLNLRTELLIEKSDIHRLKVLHTWEMIDKLKPDIVILFDHFRFEKNIGLKSLVFLTWIQDPMEFVMDKKTIGKLLPRDIILNHFITWDRILNTGYDKNKVIEAPIPANPDIYKTYRITDAEMERYSCDISLVCHTANVEQYVNEQVSGYETKEMKQAIRDLYLSYYNYVMRQEQIFYSEDEFRKFIVQYFLHHYAIEIDHHSLEILTWDLCYKYNQRVFRQALVNWILEPGCFKIKLWGKGWTTEEKYAPYAMGAAENGEELSKIYQCSKISLGNNVNGTAAARAWECMMSGGFYMINYIPEEDDVVDIRRILNIEDMVMFQGKEELVEKIKFYLEQEEERVRLSRLGQKIALEKMTFEALMKKILDELYEKLELNK